MAKITISIRLEKDSVEALDALCISGPTGRMSRSRLIESIVDNFLAQDFLQRKQIMPKVSRKPRGGVVDND